MYVILFVEVILYYELGEVLFVPLGSPGVATAWPAFHSGSTHAPSAALMSWGSVDCVA